MTRKRLLSTLVAGLLIAAAAGSVQAKEVTVIIDPNGAACLDSDVLNFNVGSLGNVLEPLGAQATFRLRKVGQPGAIAGPETTRLFSRFVNAPASLFPGVFRICAVNDVAGERIKVQLIINGQ